MKKVGLGLAPDPFDTAIKRYGIWPVTVWDINMGDPLMQGLKKMVGDGLEEAVEFTRAGSASHNYKVSLGGVQNL